jgi:hypothetical protein
MRLRAGSTAATAAVRKEMNPLYQSEPETEHSVWRTQGFWRTQALDSRRMLIEALARIELLEEELSEVKADRDHYKRQHQDPFGAVDGWPFSD